jgi:hypothetical protein
MLEGEILALISISNVKFRPVSKQLFVLGSRFFIVQQLDYNNVRAVFST